MKREKISNKLIYCIVTEENKLKWNGCWLDRLFAMQENIFIVSILLKKNCFLLPNVLSATLIYIYFIYMYMYKPTTTVSLLFCCTSLFNSISSDFLFGKIFSRLSEHHVVFYLFFSFCSSHFFLRIYLKSFLVNLWMKL